MNRSSTFSRPSLPAKSPGRVALRRRCRASLQEPSAFDELVRLAVAADPSLASLEAEQRAKRASRYAMLGPDPAASPPRNKPPWLRQRGAQGAKYHQLTSQLSELNLATVCQEARCPNIGECWNGETGTATIMIMGDACTRGCRFCAVDTAKTPPPLDPLEPEKTAEAVASWGVGYVVLTSVDRDDLDDGGGRHFRQTVQRIKALRPDIFVECLTPDFGGDLETVADLAESGLDVFAHNVETVERLTASGTADALRRRRGPRAGYFQSLAVLRRARESGVITKSSLMLGLGESKDEIVDAMLDLRDCGVDILTLGQYLQPTQRHLPVQEYVTPKAFEHWKRFGEQDVGFKYVASGPLVRSSYRAGEVFIESILRQKTLKTAQT